MFEINNIFLKNYFFYLIGVILSGTASFLTIPIIVRFYGVEEYGVYSIAQNVILILGVFGGGWITQCILRFNNYSLRFKIFAYQLFFIFSIPLSLICFLLLKTLKYDLWICIAGVLTLFLAGISGISITFYQSKLNSKKTFLFDLLRVLGFLLAVLFFHFFIFNINSFAVLIISLFLSYLISFIYILKIDFKLLMISFNYFFKKINFNFIKRILVDNYYLLNYGWPIASWFACTLILNVSDRYIIDYYLSDNELGTYSAIYDMLYKGVTIFYAPILVAGFPIMTQKYNQGLKKEAYSFLIKLIAIEIVMFIIILIVAYSAKIFFISEIIGIPVTQKSLNLIIPILTGAFIWQLAMLVHKPLEFQLRTKAMLSIVIIAMIINIFLNLWGIPKYGVIFAAYSTLFSSFIYLLFSALASKYYVNKKITR